MTCCVILRKPQAAATASCPGQPRPARPTLRFRSRRIDDLCNRRDPICRKAALSRVLPDQLFVWRNVNAIDLVISHKTLDPLNLWAEFFQDIAGLLGDAKELVAGQRSGTRNFAFNDIFGHVRGSPAFIIRLLMPPTLHRISAKRKRPGIPALLSRASSTCCAGRRRDECVSNRRVAGWCRSGSWVRPFPSFLGWSYQCGDRTRPQDDSRTQAS